MGDTRQQHNWDTWQAAWADSLSPEERRSMIESSIGPDVVYTDPTSVSHGYDEITAKMLATNERFPGATFRPERFHVHHDQAISEWTMLDGDETPIFVGVSYATFGDDDRLTSMIGFFEPAG